MPKTIPDEDEDIGVQPLIRQRTGDSINKNGAPTGYSDSGTLPNESEPLASNTSILPLAIDEEHGTEGKRASSRLAVSVHGLTRPVAKKRPRGSRIRSPWNLRELDPEEIEENKIDQEIPSLDSFKPGYGRVAAIGNLEPEFLVYRKFGWLRNYVLLHLQDELAELEDQLEDFDKREGDPLKLVSRRRDYAFKNSGRKDLLKAIHGKLAQYDEYLLRMQKIQAIKRPTERAQNNVHNLISNSESLVEEEARWVFRGTDLAALGCDIEYGWLNTFLEDSLNRISKKLTLAIFRSAEQRIKTGKEALSLLSAERLDIFLRIVLTIIAAILLLVPVYLLFRLQPTSQAQFHYRSNLQIMTVFLFTLLFSGSCSIFTKARRQEVFTATAAYCAVLVVFLGNTSNVMMSNAI